MDELEDDFEDAYATNAATAPSSGWDDLPVSQRTNRAEKMLLYWRAGKKNYMTCITDKNDQQ